MHSTTASFETSVTELFNVTEWARNDSEKWYICYASIDVRLEFVIQTITTDPRHIDCSEFAVCVKEHEVLQLYGTSIHLEIHNTINLLVKSIYSLCVFSCDVIHITSLGVNVTTSLTYAQMIEFVSYMRAT
jgi:hypothetical protein